MPPGRGPIPPSQCEATPDPGSVRNRRHEKREEAAPGGRHRGCMAGQQPSGLPPVRPVPPAGRLRLHAPEELSCFAPSSGLHQKPRLRDLGAEVVGGDAQYLLLDGKGFLEVPLAPEGPARALQESQSTCGQRLPEVKVREMNAGAQVPAIDLENQPEHPYRLVDEALLL